MPDTPAPSLAEPAAWNLVAGEYDALVYERLKFYAIEALRLVGVPKGARVLDVAAGPGTLAIEAARAADSVLAVDFSEPMIAALERRKAEQGIDNIEVQVLDAQQLPFAEEFDRVFSMFGLMFFPDRDKALREILRVLKPGGKVAVSSWVPIERVPILRSVFSAMAEALPETPSGKTAPPMSEREEVARELGAAGFTDVDVVEVAQTVEYESVDAMWSEMTRSSAPLVLLKRKLEERDWRSLEQHVVLRLAKQFGEGLVSGEMPALIGMGTKPAFPTKLVGSVD